MVVIFCNVEVLESCYLSDDFIFIEGLHLLDDRLRILPLAFRSIEYRTSVMWTYVISLSIQLGWVVTCEEYLKESRCVDYRWVKCNLNYLCMTSILCTYLLVCGIFQMSS